MPAMLPDGMASDFHIGFPPQSGFEADTTWFELQNPAQSFLTLAFWEVCRGGVRPQEGPDPGNISGLRKEKPGQYPA